MKQAPGLIEEQEYRAAGFSDQEIYDQRSVDVQEMNDAGFSGKEVQEYYGIPTPDMTAMKTYFGENLQRFNAEKQEKAANAKGPGASTQELSQEPDDFIEAFEAGFGGSVSGLMANGKMPDKVVTSHAPMAARIASNLGSFAGDLPYMIAGFAMGGGQVTGTALAFGLPAAMRKALTEGYEKGDITSFGDFWSRSSAIAWEAIKGSATGAATAVAGNAGGLVAGRVGSAMAEIATMTTVGKALEGQVPEPQDFLDAAILIFGLHGATKGATKLYKTYAETGMTPQEVWRATESDPVLKQQFSYENQEPQVSQSPELQTGLSAGETLPPVAMSAKKGERITIAEPKQEHMDALREDRRPPENYQFTLDPQAESGANFNSLKNSPIGKSMTVVDEASALDLSNDPKTVGRCFAQSAKFLKIHGGELVQGFVDADGTKVYHSWVEHGDLVYEPQTNRLFKKDLYYQMLKPEVDFRAGAAEAANKITNEGYGPFTDAGLESLLKSGVKASKDFSITPAAEPETPGHQLEAMIAENTPEPTPPAIVERTEAESKILEQVGVKEKPTKEGYSFDKFYTEFVDKLDPIKRAVDALKEKGTELAADLNPYALARMANDYKAKVKFTFKKGMLDYKTLRKTGKSFNEIIEPHKKDLQGLEAYLISKRALEIGKRVGPDGVKIESGFDLDAAREVVRQGKGQYETAAAELVEFQNGALKYLLDAGILSKESHKAMVEAGKSYIPFSRIAEETPTGGKSGKSKSLKRLTGSDKKIQSPLLSIVENTETLFRLAEKNRAVNAFIRMAEKSEGQTLVEKVPAQMRAIEVKPEEVAKAFGDEGVNPEQLEAFKIFRGMSRDLAPNEFSVFRNGKQEIYRTTPELAEAFKALDGDAVSMNMFFRFARTISGAKRLGISLTPEFILKNVFRDQLTAGVFSKGGAVPFRDMVVAMGDLIKENEHYYNWLKSGGANGTFMELGQSYYDKNVVKLNEQTGFADKAWNVLKTPVDFMRASAELAEQATRLAEFKRVSGGATEGAKIFEGGFASREVTVDFQRIGAKISALNSITAFQNISIQGLDRSIRAIKENPGGVAAKAALYITTPSILLWYANKDDARWKEIPRWQKDMFWIVLTGDEKTGTIYRIPKPQELGILFGSVPERLLEAFFNDNPHAMKDFGDTMQNLVTPAFVPDAISPAIETYFNKSLFTGAPIVPAAAEKNVLPELQQTPYTTESGKLLSKMVAAVPGMHRSQLASPAVIENAIKSWSGTLGGYALQLADQALTISGAVKPPLKPAWTLADIPFVKAFVVRYPSASAQSIQDFYENYDKSVQDLGSVKLLAKQGDLEAMQKLVKSSELEGTLLKLNGFKEAMSKQNRYIQMIYANAQMTQDEKRQQIDGVYYLMIETAKRGNKMVEAAKKTLH